VEFIASLPPEQFVYNGLERRLVREYLDDYLPDYDRLQTRYKGRQSADKVMRCRGFGDNHKELELVDSISDYMDDQKVKELMREEITEENVMDIVRVSALNVFLREYA
jgi:asparagine synthase (glutamine-hydrolysing)